MTEALYGQYDHTLRRVREALGPRWEAGLPGAERLHLWAVYMSLGDNAAAEQLARSPSTPLQRVLFEAAGLCAQDRFDKAMALLDSRRANFSQSRLLDLPTSKLALLASQPDRARTILEQRLPDLVRGIEPITARVVIPAIDLAVAQIQSGARPVGLSMLRRVAVFLDGPTAPRLPMFTLQRARVFALLNERDNALRALDRAYSEGHRTLWAIDLRPQPLFYIDPLEADPAFVTLRKEARYQQWFERIRSDNARLLAQIRTEQLAKPAD